MEKLLGLALVIIASGCLHAGTPTATADSPDSSAGENTVAYTGSGFQPSTITIEQGETVTWVDRSGGQMWVATDVHPSHTVYPGSSIQDCGTSQEEQMFDQCEAGDSYSFTFEETGEWDYHNHRNARHGGTVVVE